ncbi:PDDEXK nuclease domain-containing protein [Zavarzinella formosa]|uniref:PDDEXK nuclease domain-containing protein n=1 Tax=Zavarzinella formosa TaxID=360055 RepID=UPI00030CD994|nr:PDDEXK nuclease domain-containing protein [Zavarzinella formosa]
MPAKRNTPKKASAKKAAATPNLFGEVRELILNARQQVAQVVNAALTTTYWRVGDHIRREILQENRAGYGEEIVTGLATQLEAEFGRGFSAKSLRHMIRFAEAFPDEAIVSALRRQLGWSHFKAIIYLKEPLQREFYAEMCRIEQWSTRTLEERIRSMLYERTAISQKPEETIRNELNALRNQDQLTPDLVFRDPYVLDFLGLKDSFSEQDLETALLREVERFLLELGTGFAFVERQKRITLDGDDYYIDLLFYHRRLRRLIVIELKLNDFKPADSGQVDLYLRWLDRHERQAGEEAPLAIILCAGKKKETVEYLDLGPRGIHVAEYLTELPPPNVLRERFRRALADTRARLENRTVSSKNTPL